MLDHPALGPVARIPPAATLARMPVGVRNRRKGEKGKAYKVVKLVNGRATGAVEAQSDSRRDAEITAGIINRHVEGS